MKKLSNSELATRLRALADLYDANPEAAQPYALTDGGPALVFCMDKAETRATIEAFGPGAKADDPMWIVYQPENFPEIKIHVYKSNVCERVKVGERQVEEQVIPARPAQAEVVIPAHTEDVWEWRCGALLAPEETFPVEPLENLPENHPKLRYKRGALQYSGAEPPTEEVA